MTSYFGDEVLLILWKYTFAQEFEFLSVRKLSNCHDDAMILSPVVLPRSLPALDEDLQVRIKQIKVDRSRDRVLSATVRCEEVRETNEDHFAWV
jgi:hypothetical protein